MNLVYFEDRNWFLGVEIGVFQPKLTFLARKSSFRTEIDFFGKKIMFLIENYWPTILVTDKDYRL
jgi:hypothetical protein